MRAARGSTEPAAKGALPGRLAMGIDIGTSAIRAALVAPDGRPVAMEAYRFAPHELREPAAWRRGLSAVLQGLGGLHGVGAIAVDGTSGTLLGVDAKGEPVGPPIMYDERVDDDDLVARLDAHAPVGATARGGGSGAARAAVLARRRNVARLVHQADWIAGLLTGRFDLSDETNALKTGYDPVARAWPDWLGRAGLPVDRLPRVLPVGAVFGPALGKVAASCGVPASAVVVAGATDGCASFLATGASAPGEGVTALGSTLVIKLLSDRPITDPASGVYSHRVGDMWLAGGASNSGGRVLAAEFDAAEIEALSARIAPAADPGGEFYPLPAPGERFPINDPALAPVMPATDDPVMRLHGLLHGMARIEAMGYARLTALGAPALARVLSVGGGAGNAVWSALRERQLGVPVLRAHETEAALGTARIALSHLLGTPLGGMRDGGGPLDRALPDPLPA